MGPAWCLNCRPAKRLAASQPGEDGRGGGIPLANRMCSNHPRHPHTRQRLECGVFSAALVRVPCCCAASNCSYRWLGGAATSPACRAEAQRRRKPSATQGRRDCPRAPRHGKADVPANAADKVVAQLCPPIQCWGQTEPRPAGFEIFISWKIFDRNSNVRFHQSMAAIRLQKSIVHAPGEFNNS